ncbi:MAG: hypothetical protein EXS17_06185 [Phycisphaerales bacterium]|nr:hypothetical protein [Phycisphaerales bacterium]
MQHTESDTARVVASSCADGRIIVSIPHTQYEIELNLLPNDPLRNDGANAVLGTHITGVVHARALKMHRATGGGVYIEPVQGRPRSVQGRILATDVVNNKVLAHVVIPMWVSVPQGQAASDFSTGELVNFYVESGTSFTPTAG